MTWYLKLVDFKVLFSPCSYHIVVNNLDLCQLVAFIINNFSTYFMKSLRVEIVLLNVHIIPKWKRVWYQIASLARQWKLDGVNATHQEMVKLVRYIANFKWSVPPWKFQNQNYGNACINIRLVSAPNLPINIPYKVANLSHMNISDQAGSEIRVGVS